MRIIPVIRRIKGPGLRVDHELGCPEYQFFDSLNGNARIRPSVRHPVVCAVIESVHERAVCVVEGPVRDNLLGVVLLGQQQFVFGIDQTVGIDEINGIDVSRDLRPFYPSHFLKGMALFVIFDDIESTSFDVDSLIPAVQAQNRFVPQENRKVDDSTLLGGPEFSS